MSTNIDKVYSSLPKEQQKALKQIGGKAALDNCFHKTDSQSLNNDPDVSKRPITDSFANLGSELDENIAGKVVTYTFGIKADGKPASIDEQVKSYLNVHGSKPPEEVAGYFTRVSGLNKGSTITLDSIVHRPFTKGNSMTLKSPEAEILQKMGYTIK